MMAPGAETWWAQYVRCVRHQQRWQGIVSRPEHTRPLGPLWIEHRTPEGIRVRYPAVALKEDAWTW